MAAEYNIIQPEASRAQEITEFLAVQLGERLAATDVDPEQIAAHLEAMRAPRAVVDFEDSFAHRMDEPGFYCRIVDQDAGVQGLMMAVRAGTEMNGRKYGTNEIWNLELAEDLRGQGVASKMMGNFLTKHADPTRFTGLIVASANTRAIRYYQKRWRFQPVGYETIKRVGSMSVPALNMTRWPDEKIKEKTK
jgi:ribosomal protein S18 acetylase RimI-like enzyme